MTLLVLQPLSAQNLMGYQSDNYAGVHNISFQPADLVDSRYLIDINLIGNNFQFGNNYIGLSRKALTTTGAFEDSLFQDKYLVERINGKNKTVYTQNQMYLPAISVSFGKNAIAFSSHLNTAANVEGVSEDLAFLVYRELDYSNLWNIALDNQNFSVQTMAWADYGLTYGREVMNNGKHYLKAAGTVKLLQGLGAAHFYSENAQVSFPNDDTIRIYDTDVSYGHSSNFELDADGLAYKFVGKPTFGFDLGVVYELRRPADQYTYKMDGREDWVRKDKNKYILKAGVSIIDMGVIPFTKANGSRSFYANAPQGIDLDEFDFDDVASFDSVLQSKFTMVNDSGSVYRMNLPTRINMTVDYNIWKGFYVNAASTIGFRFRKDAAKTRTISNFSVTPRFEHKWVGVGLPFSYDILGNWHLGAYLRLGPIVVGTNDWANFAFKKNIYDANFYFALRIPIPHGTHRDRDKDFVSNRLDDCKKEPGTWENKGCPVLDKDNDGVLDTDDKCPSVKGSAANNGCPDTDGDGIVDADDVCPKDAGSKEFNGCPDNDKDGLADINDDCPSVAGDKALNGCPDTDKDGLKDTEDQCPTVAGPLSNKGCPVEDPDTDKDGLKDKQDACPQTAGPIENKGCPWPDTDKDGVADKDDACPKTPGIAELKGCPKIEKEAQAVLDQAFKNLEFETSKTVIKAKSLESLDRLAKLIQEKPNATILLEGHTDSEGAAADNLVLSEKRADMVKKYLVSKGVNPAQISTKGYGETKPIADNNTSAGRQKNRRVEMTLNFN